MYEFLVQVAAGVVVVALTTIASVVVLSYRRFGAIDKTVRRLSRRVAKLLARIADHDERLNQHDEQLDEINRNRRPPH